ncbi:hypothetical protein EDB81DRAFT_654365 [Dactylonectria macrodidyma]|uniref:Uncharacterized protein n=1 Tax=Dactylonectria macrodidyma TaxID=307937 RepID=A0A9P9EMI8_9HYPO|nr:hypothetical protein EDB81DRAFT_654365 [Dactylonectria macrodidyma]
MANIDHFQRLTESISWDNKPLLLSAGVSYGVGLLQYVIAIQLSLRHGKSPLPFWMHSFYLAHDSAMWYVFSGAAPRYNQHWFMRATSTAMFLWSFMEIWCIHRAITKDRKANFSSVFGPNPPLGPVLGYALALQAAMYGVIILGFVLFGEGTFLHWFTLTNALMAIGPTHEYLRRGSREGLSLSFCFITIIGTIFTYAPFGFWALTVPEIFAQPVYYALGVLFVPYTIWCFYIVAQYPPK